MISLGLNLILGVMLFCGLVLGLRLERRLRGLKDSQADFAKAVSELDQAAARTEQALARLRAGTEDAKLDLAARIDQARLLTQRLDGLIQDAAAAERPLPLSQPLSQPEPAAVARQALGGLRPPARPAAPAVSRSRAVVDDDLFQDAPRPAHYAGLRR